ncbi:MAG: DUF4349 domain-containing protein [Bacteroidetes bacterium]|nr:DUF4349 domain-containing protein [Bacteroidota bacterium]
MNDLKNCFNNGKAFVRTGTVLPEHFGIKFFLLLLVSVILFSCGPSASYKAEQEAATASSSESAMITDSVAAYAKGIATDTINGLTHNFIRKADLKFKVDNVLNSSKKIEDIVTGYGGYISSSELTSNKNYTQSTQINKDSVLEQTFYTTTNHISLRVPNQKLDTVLRQISDLALFIDYRTLHSDDVKMKLFSNKLAENRYKNYTNKLQQKAEKVTTKQSQVLSTQENILAKQTSADEKRIESYELADQVNYSTITLEAYQAQTVMKQLLAVQEHIEPYQASFFSKLGDSFLNGFKILKEFVLGLISIWGLLLILTGLGFGIRWFIMWINKKVRTAA